MSEYIIEMGNSSYKSSSGLLCADVSQQREKIVRCRDCKEYRPELYNHIACELLGRYVEPDGFCKWGEKAAAKVTNDERNI